MTAHLLPADDQMRLSSSAKRESLLPAGFALLLDRSSTSGARRATRTIGTPRAASIRKQLRQPITAASPPKIYPGDTIAMYRSTLADLQIAAFCAKDRQVHAFEL